MENSESTIYGDSTEDQIKAINHVGSHARMLAGPGTGKTRTLTRRVLSLILRHRIDASSILLLTFTRLATAQLKNEIAQALGSATHELPHVSTLHSFALKQILHNRGTVGTLPGPIRIADDWEERNIVQEDIKRILNLSKIKEVQDLFHQLSSDWEKLEADKPDWEQSFPNAQFLGAWMSHREQYGETLRAELVYQLKKQLSQNPDFNLDQEYAHILIDEYQDLNACDLAIVKELGNRGAELFVAGDDDQSIYGFRFASPQGIRSFDREYHDVTHHALEVCFRCDKQILRYGEFVANLDPNRLPKPTRPRDGAENGEVLIVSFRDQTQEAEKISKKIRSLIEQGTKEDQICVLLRGDRHRSYSKPITEALKNLGIDVCLSSDSELDDSLGYRKVLAVLRLLIDKTDSLAWRTLLQIDKNNGLGTVCIETIENYENPQFTKFSESLRKIAEEPSNVARFGTRISNFVAQVDSDLEELSTCDDVKEIIYKVIEDHMAEEELKNLAVSRFLNILTNQEEPTLEELIKAVSISSSTNDNESVEQEVEETGVKVLTMHQAKGLTFDVCFIVGAEDEIIPGRNRFDADKLGDERRLLYVSMTRARHKLYISYCNRRFDQQQHSGQNSNTSRRSLTSFLRHANIPIKQFK